LGLTHEVKIPYKSFCMHVYRVYLSKSLIFLGKEIIVKEFCPAQRWN